MNKDCLSCTGRNTKCSDKLSWRQLLFSVLAAFMAYLVILGVKATVSAKSQTTSCLTQAEVKDRVEREKVCLTIYDGKVYDFTMAKRWDITGHVGKHLCGKVYDKETIEAGPHKIGVMDRFYKAPICGKEGGAVVSVGSFSWKWVMVYAALIFFILNFATCYAMPWGTWREPWSGDLPGPDNKDSVGHFPMTHWHKIWAWCAVFSLSLHAILEFSCVLLGKCY